MSNIHFGLLFILGVGVFGGIVGAWLFQKLRIPQVVGYIIIGLIIGQTGFNLIGARDIASFGLLNQFALGIIGFLVGGELKASIMKKHGKQFSLILLGEGLGAFMLVGFSCGIVVYFISHNISIAVAAGVVFGAIASATDPASTINVLWEYRSRGILTTSLIAVVALDDALAMALYGLGTSVAQMLTGGSTDMMEQLARICIELFGAIATGVAAGVLLNIIHHRLAEEEKVLALTIGTLLVVIGIAIAAHMDVILATMAIGVTLTNLAPKRSKDLFKVVRSFASPIYVIFFVLVGARLCIGNMPGWLWLIVGLYILCRTAGKILGSMLGAKITGAAPVVQKYCGLGLFAQGGVAVGLSIMASHHLGNISVTPNLTLGDMIIFGVTTTTLFVQVVGPPLVKLAITLAGELGRNVTEEDVIATLKVCDVLSPGVKVIHNNDRIQTIMSMFSENEQLVYPVVDKQDRTIGMLSFDTLKDVLTDQDTWQWLVASDIMGQANETVQASTPLQPALEKLKQLHTDQLAVIENDETRRPLGILDMRTIQRFLHEELLRRQQAQPVQQ